MTIQEDKVRTGLQDSGVPVPPPAGKPPTKTKRGRGRPKGSGKDFVSALPAPPKRDTFNADEFFTYLRSIPEDKLNRIMLSWYRYLPACDITEDGTKDKCIRKIPGESHPFKDEDWQKQVLHLFGCGNYGCFLNESPTGVEPGTKTIMICRKIETIWDPDSFPPVLDPKTLLETFPANQAYVQWLRTKGVQLPSEVDRDKEEMEMQISDTISKLTDTVIAQANRINTPVPQVQQQPGMAEKLSFEMASSAIDMFKEKAKVDLQSNAQQSNGLDLVDKVLSAAKEMSSAGTRNGNGADDTMKLFMADVLESRREAAKRAEAAEERNSRLMEKMFTAQANPAPVKGVADSLKETLELMTMIKDIAGNGKGDSGGESESESKPSSWPAMLIQNAPQLLQTGVQIWGQFNQSLAMMSRMKELDAFAKTGQLPPGVQPPQVQPPQVPPQQPTADANGMNSNGANPAPAGPVLTPEQIEQQRQEQIMYAQYHPLINMIGQPLITHLNDPEKDGYDFAEWFIAGQGRLMYDQVKGVGLEKLMGAIRSFAPLWQQIGGIEVKVKQFVEEFLTIDELPAELAPTEGKEN